MSSTRPALPTGRKVTMITGDALQISVTASDGVRTGELRALIDDGAGKSLRVFIKKPGHFHTRIHKAHLSLVDGELVLVLVTP